MRANYLKTAAWILCVTALAAGCFTAESPGQVTAVALEPLKQTVTNSFYSGNRPPLLASPLIKLPVGSIQPQGWLRGQMELAAEGMIGRLEEISKWCQITNNAWSDPLGQGLFGWEELPYWLKGITALGYDLKNERIISCARPWIDAMIAGQRADGYFGPEQNIEKPDLWPNMVALYALRSHYEATGDARVLSLMSRYFHWMRAVKPKKFLPSIWQKWRGGDNLDSIYWLYNRTGESWLLDLARLNHEHTADWTGGIPTWHGVNISQAFREPAQYYQQSHDKRFLAATLRNYDTVMEKYGQAPGGMFGADENAREGRGDPRQAAETCSMVEFMWSDELLLSITGDPVWADRCEDIAFNSLPASMTPDLRGLHYLTAPNQVQLDRANKNPGIGNRGNMFSYDPHGFRCCQHNVAFGWPYFAEHLWMATPGNGLAAALYSPCSVTAKVGDGATVAIVETTDYPFDENIVLTIATSRPVSFPLLLRVPAWCEQPQVRINERPTASPSMAKGWLKIERLWKSGDRVTLRLPMVISATVWEKNKNAVSISRGPLDFSLKIGERWERYGGTDRWPAFEVFPTTPWNYGLVVDKKQPDASFQLIKRAGPISTQPFTCTNAPLEIQATGRRIPHWIQETNGLISEIPSSPASSAAAAETITLIPMGCARLRVSAFPELER